MIILFRFSPHSMKYTCTQHSKKKKILALITRRSKKKWESLYQSNRFGRNLSLESCYVFLKSFKSAWLENHNALLCRQPNTSLTICDTTRPLTSFRSAIFLHILTAISKRENYQVIQLAESDPNNGEKRKTWKRD